jgi:hypothetical protein
VTLKPGDVVQLVNSCRTESEPDGDPWTYLVLELLDHDEPPREVKLVRLDEHDSRPTREGLDDVLADLADPWPDELPDGVIPFMPSSRWRRPW